MNLIKAIPNTVTSMNLLCGTIGVLFACKGQLDVAFIFMLAASVCDFLDGFLARLFGAYSDTGKELDSLADVVSFGVLPSIMLCILMKTYSFGDSLWCYAPLLIAVFSALRLAKFNLDERQHKSFLGLPTPACAMICGALAYFTAQTPVSFLAVWCSGKVFIPVLTVVLCCLLVSEIPMFSMKLGSDSGLENRKRMAFAINIILIIVIVAIMRINWSMVILLSFVVYVLMNIVFAILKIR